MRARAEPPHAELSLLSDVRGVLPGQPFTLGVRFELDRGWHIYWLHAGDSGQAPRIDWQLPDGFHAGAIEWPYPQQVSPPPVVTYGYEDSVLLPVTVTPPPHAGDGPVTVDATVHYLICKQLCLPEQARLTTTLPWAATLIDNIFSNDIDCISRAAVIVSDVSDHYPVFVQKPISHNVNSPIVITYRKYSDQNVDNFRQALRSYDFNGVMSTANANDATVVATAYANWLSPAPIPSLKQSKRIKHQENRSILPAVTH